MEPHINDYAVGVDVGGSHVCSAAIDLGKGKRISEPCVTPLDSRSDATEIIDALSENIGKTIMAVGAGHVAGVGFAFPGPFDYVHGVSTVSGVGKYENIYGLDISASLYARLSHLGVGSFRFVNDASAFALGEYAAGAAAGVRNMAAFTLGTGVGSGFVADGRLVESGPDVPAYGWVYHLPFEGGIVDEAFSTRWICRRFKELSGEAVCGAKDVADRCRAGDKTAIGLFVEYGTRLAEFAAPVLERFGADMLVLGGNISRAYEFFGPSLEKGLLDRGCMTLVRTSVLLDEAAMTGAAALFR